MKGRMIKKVWKFFLSVTVAVMIVMTVHILTQGMWLLGIPEAEKVQKITVSYPDLTDEIKEFSDEDSIELAVQLTGFLKYSLGETPDEDEAPLITIHYYLKNGESVSVSASRDTVWWKGKAYAIKEEEMFINLAEGIFFWEEMIRI